MRVEREDLLVTRLGIAIVDQHTYAHTAIGSAHQQIGQQAPRFVAAKNEILQVERALGRPVVPAADLSDVARDLRTRARRQALVAA